MRRRRFEPAVEALERAVCMGTVEEVATATVKLLKPSLSHHDVCLNRRVVAACLSARQSLSQSSRTMLEAASLLVALVPDDPDIAYWDLAMRVGKSCSLACLNRLSDNCCAMPRSREARLVLRMFSHRLDDEKRLASIVRIALSARDFSLLAKLASRDEVCRELSSLARSSLPSDDLEALAVAASASRPQLVFAHWPDLVRSLCRRRSFSALARVLRAPGRRVVDNARSSSTFGPGINELIWETYEFLKENDTTFEALGALCEVTTVGEDDVVVATVQAGAWRPLRFLFEARLGSRVEDLSKLTTAAISDDDALEALSAASFLETRPELPAALLERCSLPTLPVLRFLEKWPLSETAICRALDERGGECKVTAAAARAAGSLRRPFSDHLVLSLARTATKSTEDNDTAAATCRALGVAAELGTPLVSTAVESVARVAKTHSSHKVLAQVAFALGNAATRTDDQLLVETAFGLVEHPSPKVAAGALRAAGLASWKRPARAAQLAVVCRSYVSDSVVANKVRRNACTALGRVLPSLEDSKAEVIISLLDYIGSLTHGSEDDDDVKALVQAAEAAEVCIEVLDESQTAAAFATVLRSLVRVDGRLLPPLFDRLALLALRLLELATPAGLNPQSQNITPHLDFLYLWLTTTQKDHPKLPDLLDKVADALDNNAGLILDRFMARARLVRRARAVAAAQDDEDEL